MTPDFPIMPAAPSLTRTGRRRHPAVMPSGPGLDPVWAGMIEALDFAFQPIVNIHTGRCFGYEALLRNHREIGFETVPDFFDACVARGQLAETDAALHGKALAKFAGLAHHQRCKLFLNVDNRALAQGFDGERLRTLSNDHGVAEGNLFLEISERHPVGMPAEASTVLRRLKGHGFKLAVDDFGTGFSGLQMLYFAEPDILKIDRFFISDISTDSKKKLFLSKIVNIAHLLGAVVVAEGVETEQEYFVCKDIGCDLVQGYLVQRPTCRIEDLQPQYSAIEALARRERRGHDGDQKMIRGRVEAIAPISVDADMLEVFDRFRADKTATFFPVVDGGGEPLGIVRERDLKEYTYSLYGRELINNRAYGRRLGHFVTRCPIVDVNADADSILQAFSATDGTEEGIVIVDDMQYVGFLSTRSLLQVINEKNLQAARDQNPLTRLPGNNLIHQYLSRALPDADNAYRLAYFDFDNFKPFNDRYGFRIGDRAILLFAELLAKKLRREQVFVAHVGGDDFFAAMRGGDAAAFEAEVEALIAQFGHDVESFYDEGARRAGGIVATDRDGRPRRFPLLGVSAALLHLPPGRAVLTTDEVGWVIADLKKAAKAAERRICSAVLPVGAAPACRTVA